MTAPPRGVAVLLAVVLATICAAGCGGGGGDLADAALQGSTDASALVDRRSPGDAPARDAPPARDVPIIPGCALSLGRALSLPMDSVAGTLLPPGRIAEAGCVGKPTAGAEVIHPITLGARTGLEIAAGALGEGQVALSVRRACESAASELACATRPRGATSLRVVLDPGTYYVVVDAVFGALSYELLLRSFTPAPNARCADAAPLDNGATLTGRSTAGGTLPGEACGDPDTPRVYYALRVPAFHRAVVSARALGGSSPGVAILDGCGGACLAATRPSATGLAVATFDHRGELERELRVAVMGTAPTSDATFDLSVRYEPLPRNATCATATPVAHGARLVAQDASGGLGAPAFANCVGERDRRLYYSLRVPPGHTLRATATPGGTAWTPTLRLLDGCDHERCLADDGFETGSVARTLDYRNDGAVTRDVTLAVGARGASESGRFDLAVSVLPVASDGRCETPRRVRGGDRLSGEDLSEGAIVGPMVCDGTAGTTYRRLHYAVAVPAGNTMRATVTPTGSLRWDARAYVVGACDTGAACLARSVGGALQAPEILTYTNRSGATGEVILGVIGNLVVGTFDLAVDFTQPPANALCVSATPLALDTPLRGQDRAVGVEDPSPRCDPSARGPTLYYSVTVPPASQLTATATPTSAWVPAVFAFDECASTTCAARAIANGVLPATVRLNNLGPTPRRMFLAVAGVGPAVGTFDLAATALSIVPAVVCEGATPLTPGVPLRGQDTQVASELPTACVEANASPVLHYAATIPPRSVLHVRAVATGASWRPVLRAQPACGATTCLATEPSSDTERRGILVPNPGSTSTAVIVTVGRPSGLAPGGTFDLFAEVQPVASNASCVEPRPVEMGARLDAEPLWRGLEAPPADCEGFVSRPHLFYALRVPPRSRLHVEGTPSPGASVSLRLLSNCDQRRCLATADASPSFPGRFAWSNYASEAVTVVLAVAGLVRPLTTVALRVDAFTAELQGICSLPLRIDDVLLAQDGRGALDGATVCRDVTSGGGWLHYVTRVGADETLVVRATPTGATAWSPYIRIGRACGVASCEALSETRIGTDAVAVLPSTSGAREDVRFAVGPALPTYPEGTFDLRVDRVRAPTNVTCEVATPIAVSGVLRSQFRRGAERLDASCLPGSRAAVVYYRASVPAGATLQLSARAGGWEPSIRVLDGCSSRACLASSDSARVTPATFTNTSSSTREVVIAVGTSLESTAFELFDLVVELRP